jgi:hypothetical protein
LLNWSPQLAEHPFDAFHRPPSKAKASAGGTPLGPAQSLVGRDGLGFLYLLVDMGQ